MHTKNQWGKKDPPRARRDRRLTAEITTSMLAQFKGEEAGDICVDSTSNDAKTKFCCLQTDGRPPASHCIISPGASSVKSLMRVGTLEGGRARSGAKTRGPFPPGVTALPRHPPRTLWPAAPLPLFPFVPPWLRRFVAYLLSRAHLPRALTLFAHSTERPCALLPVEERDAPTARTSVTHNP